MASRGTTKALSVDHENYVARTLGGERTINSGATDRRKGDVDRVRIPYLDVMLECKLTGDVVKVAKSISVKLDDLEKLSDEADITGECPMIALRIINPDSPIADDKGNVDWVALPIGDLAYLLDCAKTVSG